MVGYEEIIRQRLEALVRWRGMEEREKMIGLRPMRKRRAVTRRNRLRNSSNVTFSSTWSCGAVQNGTNIETSVLGMVFKGKAKELVSKELDKKVFLLYWNSLVRKFFEQKKGKRLLFDFIISD